MTESLAVQGSAGSGGCSLRTSLTVPLHGEARPQDGWLLLAVAVCFGRGSVACTLWRVGK